MISPDETLKIVQELYEKKLVTYPRTDARVLSTAVAKEIGKNLSGLRSVPEIGAFAEEVLAGDAWKKIGKTRYTNDSQITDHYAIIPTGQGLGALRSLRPLAADVYDMICRRFLSIFYPPAVFEKKSIEVLVGTEHFFSSFRFRLEEGWMKVAGMKNRNSAGSGQGKAEGGPEKSDEEDMTGGHAEDPAYRAMIDGLRKGSIVAPEKYEVKEGETSPPKRYTSGSMILAMENAGQLIEDEELRSQIKGSGIGTSATRAEILKKLFNIRYLSLNAKTQIITPTLLGEMVYEAVEVSMKQLLNPELTASWEKGLTMVSDGTISPGEYMEKLRGFVGRRTGQVKSGNAGYLLREAFLKTEGYYRGEKRPDAGKRVTGKRSTGKKKTAENRETSRT